MGRPGESHDVEATKADCFTDSGVDFVERCWRVWMMDTETWRCVLLQLYQLWVDLNLEILESISKLADSRENTILCGCASLEPFSKHIYLLFSPQCLCGVAGQVLFLLHR